MTPRYFADYAKNNPTEYTAFSDSMWNGFVSATKYVPFIGKFFSFTPAPEILNNPISNGEAIGVALGDLYDLSQGIDKQEPPVE